MDEERWARIEELFFGALKRPGSERSAYLERECEDDATLLDEVRGLLESADLAAAPGAGESHAAEDGARPGMQIGPYMIVRELARGGMAVVYLAARADHEFERLVALKLLPPGRTDDRLSERFRRERQILADLDHPQIARLIDGGQTGDGSPYLVMEYIQGIPIDEYCDSRRLTVRQRLGLFRRICSAVEYAHRNLVIHRDIKPGNVLVTEDGEPKLLDFGIAQLLTGDAASRGLTEAGQRPLTPAYASPEQLAGRPLTTATDVYSLAAVLFKLLVGRPPGEPRELASVAATSEPGRAADDDATEARSAAEIARLRSTDPRQLRRALQGDLDTILQQALHDDPSRRYASASLFADDIRRHLESLPVTARPDTFGYRARKFVQRYTLGTALAAGLLLTLLATAVLVSVLAARIGRERDQVERERSKAEQVSSFLVDLFAVVDPEHGHGNSVKAREILDRGASILAAGLDDEPELKGSLSHTMGKLYFKLGLYGEAERMLEEAVELRRTVHGAESPEVAESLGQLAWVEDSMGDFRRARELRERAHDLHWQRLGPEHPAVAEDLGHLALLASRRGEFDLAEELVERSLSVTDREYGPESAEAAHVYQNLGVINWERGKAKIAETLYRRAMAIYERTLGTGHSEYLRSAKSLALVLSHDGRLEESERLYRRVLGEERELLGPEHPRLAHTLTGLANLLSKTGRPDEARALLHRALEIERQSFGPRHLAIAVTLTGLASLARRTGDLGAAAELYEEALGIARETRGADNPMTVHPLGGLGRVRLEAGDARGAEPLLRQSYELRRRHFPEESRMVVEAALDLGRCLVALGEIEEAERVLRSSHAAALAGLGDSDETTVELGRLLASVGASVPPA